jgi:hypothetical protein
LIPPEDLKNLIYLLSFARDDTVCQASLQQIAHAMGVSIGRARARMEHLSQIRWNGASIVRPIRRFTEEAYQLSPGLITNRNEIDHSHTTSTKGDQPGTSLKVVGTKSTDVPDAPPQHAPSEVVVELSRKKHGTPREAVERNIANQMGWEYPFRSPNEIRRETEEDGVKPITKQSSEAREVQQSLVSVGITEDQAADLIAEFPLDRMRQQLAWLPLRNAKNKASFLIAAIRLNYDAPGLNRKPKKGK